MAQKEFLFAGPKLRIRSECSWLCLLHLTAERVAELITRSPRHNFTGRKTLHHTETCFPPSLLCADPARQPWRPSQTLAFSSPLGSHIPDRRAHLSIRCSPGSVLSGTAAPHSLVRKKVMSENPQGQRVCKDSKTRGSQQ